MTDVNYNNTATSFYLGLMKIRSGFIFVSTTSSLNVTYCINIDSLNYTYNETITKGRPNYYHYVSYNAITSSSSFEYRFNGIHVTSSHPVTLTFVSNYPHFSEYLVLPCHNYPGVSQYEYYAVSTDTPYNTTLSQALIIGCHNDTTITIIPSVSLFLPLDAQVNGSIDILVTNGTRHTITLHEGQTLLVSKEGIDISGTHFISNKPLTVISGHECGNVSDTGGRCNYLQLQIPPTITWGRKYLLSGFTDSYTYGRNTTVGRSTTLKVLTAHDNTTVTLYCNGTTNINIYASSGTVGIYQLNMSLSQFCYMEANRPIFVVLFLERMFFTNMILVPSTEQYVKEIEFDQFIWRDIMELFIMTTPELFNPSSILYNGQPITNWAAVFDLSRNIVGYGTKITIDYRYFEFENLRSRHINYSIVHTGHGRLSVMVTKYTDDLIFGIIGYPIVMSLLPSNAVV